MSILVFVELADEKVKGTSKEAVAYGAALDGEVTALAIGKISHDELARLGGLGASKVLHVEEERLQQGEIKAYAEVLSQAMDSVGAHTLVLAKSSLGDPVAARVAVKKDASFVSNVTALPDTGSGYVVTRSIYTGKAFARVEMKKENKILAIKRNAVGFEDKEGSAPVEDFTPTLEDSLFDVKITSVDQKKGEILLPEAEIVVSGGRGMKGPENWGMLEDLAEVLGAATGCSKPVSDMGWRPHHEHVGQTGVKVSPNLYIAVGISGAIQHLAGVNSSKCIVVINKDEEAPFFKAADYGIVGDAFEVVPKLTEAIKASK